MSDEEAKRAPYWDTFSGKMADEQGFKKIQFINGEKDKNGDFISIHAVVTE